MVWVDEGRLIELLERALRGAELREEIRELKAHTAGLEADSRACELLHERRHALGMAADAAVDAELLTELPLTAEGELHEAAFVALVEAQLWAGWSERLAVHEDQDDDTRRS